MGIALPQVVTSDRASGAQVIDGSLKFDSSQETQLSRTPSSAGNRRTWTWSGWVKKQSTSETNPKPLFTTNGGSNSTSFTFRFDNSTDDVLRVENDFAVGAPGGRTSAKFRDYSGWLHVVLSMDTTQASISDGMKIYVNGTQHSLTNTVWTQNIETNVNSTVAHFIGGQNQSNRYLDGMMSQVYLIDGQALGPESFGYTDLLTNTWRPKKAAIPGFNDGTVWSSNSTNFTNPGQGFNGTNTNYAEVSSSAAKGTFTFPKSIQVENNVTFISSSATSGNLFVNNSSTAMQGTSFQIQTISFSGTLSSISLQSSSQPVLYQFFVDGKPLIDSVTNNFGNNGFYLPMDGNSPIGEDKSGAGNNWTPVNFGGSVALDNPQVSGAKPILNTDGGGNVARVGVRTDAYHANLVLALPLVGSANDVSNLVNSGSTTKTITVTNAVASSVQSNFYNGSWYFDGTGDYITASASSDFGLVEQDWTVECYAYIEGLTNSYGRLWYLEGDSSSSIDGIYFSNTHMSMGTTNVWSVGDGTGGEYSRNKWIHIAVCHDSTNMRMYIDGVQTLTTSNNFYNSSSKKITLMSTNNGSYGGLGVGYIQDFRVINGVAKYTSNFVVPSTSPDILPDTPSGVSGGSKLAKVTDGAVSFDGSGDYLTSVESSDEYDFPSGDWTIEYFAYCNSEPSDAASFSNTKSFSSAYRSIIVEHNSGNISLLVNTTGSGGWTTVGTTTNDLNRWRHIALVRNSGTISFYVDGIGRGSTSSTPYDNANNDTVYFGRNGGDGSGYFSGFISNARIVKGTALYTANFTPPTRELTDVTNTKLLCCQSPSNVKLSPVAPTVGTTANTRFNSNFESIPTTVNGLTVTNNSSVPTTSAGTNVYGFTNCADLSGSNSLSVNLGAIPQVTTIDIIFKVTGTTDNKYLFAISNTGLVRRTGSSLAWYNNSADQTISTTPDDGQWHHLRVTPKSLYFDGVETKTTSTTPNIFVSANGYMALGAYRNDSGTIQYNGAIDIGLVRVMPGVDLGAPSSIPITTNGTLSSTETIPSDGVIFTAGNAAATNFNPFNTDINTVRGQETGYCTLNPLFRSGTYSDGNLVQTTTSGNGHYRANFAITASSGKYYFEYQPTGSNVPGMIGLCEETHGLTTNLNGAKAYSYYGTTGYKQGGPSAVDAAYGATFTFGDVIGVAFDTDNNTLEYFKNGASQGVAFTSFPNYPYYPAFSAGSSSNTVTYNVNFGQKPFKFSPPAGYQPLNAANVRPETVIVRPDHYVKTVLWTGNDVARSIVTGNAPDLVWIKDRSITKDPVLCDSVRGAGETLRPDDAGANVTAIQRVSSFNSNGFSVGTDSGVNNNNDNFVGWTWKAGGNKNTFNVDDVGYASASDVNMSVGALNSASYNQSQTFSSGTLTGSMVSGREVSKAFDADSTTFAQAANNTQATFVFNTPVTITGTVTFKAMAEAGNNYVRLTGNSGNSPDITNTGSDGISVSSDVSSSLGTTITGFILDETPGSGTCRLYEIRVGGKLLVDSGVTPPNVPSIAATGCSIGTKQGFSIIKYTSPGSTDDQSFPHGLNKKPSFIIVKNLDRGYSWDVYHQSLGYNAALILQLTNATRTGVFSAEPTSSVVNTKTSYTHYLTDKYVAYCWHDVHGLQKFGSYVGNNSADGPFIELGFRPALVWIKSSSFSNSYTNWDINDSVRDTHNPADATLAANLNDNENSGNIGTQKIDFLSNGFKIRQEPTSSSKNTSGQTYIYCAWAEAPASNLYGGQSNAR